jgi:hypothetical protein
VLHQSLNQLNKLCHPLSNVPRALAACMTAPETQEDSLGDDFPIHKVKLLSVRSAAP